MFGEQRIEKSRHPVRRFTSEALARFRRGNDLRTSVQEDSLTAPAWNERAVHSGYANRRFSNAIAVSPIPITTG